MKPKKLLDAMGDIRPEYIESAMQEGAPAGETVPRSHAVLYRIVTAASLAACIALAAGCGLWIYHTGRAARENSVLENMEASQTLATEQASRPDDSAYAGEQKSGDPENSDGVTVTDTTGAGSDAAAQTTAAEPTGTTATVIPETKVSVKITTTAVSATTDVSAPVQHTDVTEGEQQAHSPQMPEEQEPVTRLHSVLFKDHSSSGWEEGGGKHAFVIHSLDQWDKRNAAGDAIDDMYRAFFNASATSDWRNEEFFAEYDVILAAVWLGSGSYDMGIKSLNYITNGNPAKTDYPKLLLDMISYAPQTMTCDMCCYYAAICVPKGVIEGNPQVKVTLQKIGENQFTYTDPFTGETKDRSREVWRENTWRVPKLTFIIED